MKQAGRLACGLVLVWAAWAMLAGLWQGPLAVYDEGTYAQVVQESVERRDFLTFMLNGNLWFEKPPLYFWLAGAATYLTDDPILGIRLPAALFGIAVVALVMALAYRASYSYFIAAFAGAFLLSIQPFVDGAREARLDLLASFFILLAYGAALEAKYLWFGIAVALAVLSKSVLAVFAAAALPLVALWLNDWSFWHARRFWQGVVLAAAIVLPWHLYEWWQWGNAFWAAYLGYHVFERYERNLFVSPGLQSDYLARLYEQAQAAVLAFFAALVFVPLALYKPSRYESAPLVLACLLLGLMALVFFSAQTRALSYLIPLYPFAALGVALVCWHLIKFVRKGMLR